MPRGHDLSRLKIVVDCAHGAAYKVAPRVLGELGAEIIPIGCSPNGRNINEGCGSTQPELLATTVKGVGAQNGHRAGWRRRPLRAGGRARPAGGWRPAAVRAGARRQARGELRGPVVGTVMSNLGLEQALAAWASPSCARRSATAT
jgi:phosphoglucosamine mutase